VAPVPRGLFYWHCSQTFASQWQWQWQWHGMGSSCFVGKVSQYFSAEKMLKGCPGRCEGIEWYGFGNSVRWMITVCMVQSSSTPSFNFRIKLGYYPETRPPKLARSLFTVYFATLVLSGKFGNGGGKSCHPRKTATTTWTHPFRVSSLEDLLSISIPPPLTQLHH